MEFISTLKETLSSNTAINEVFQKFSVENFNINTNNEKECIDLIDHLFIVFSDKNKHFFAAIVCSSQERNGRRIGLI